MPDRDRSSGNRRMTGALLAELRTALLAAGTHPATVRRMTLEIREHYEDLIEEAVASGVPPECARQLALERLGQPEDIAMAVRSQPELLRWSARWPRLALVCYPLACAAALPAAPLIAGIRHRAIIARWSACLLLSAILTATMMLVLQLMILVA